VAGSILVTKHDEVFEMSQNPQDPQRPGGDPPLTPAEDPQPPSRTPAIDDPPDPPEGEPIDIPGEDPEHVREPGDDRPARDIERDA
jgi:hypothetical protein